MTDEEIKIKATKIAMKESCDRCDKILCDSPSEYCKWFNGCYKLAKANAELNRDKTELVNSVTELKGKVTELEEQIEKMKHCWNCENRISGNHRCVDCESVSGKTIIRKNWELAE